MYIYESHMGGLYADTRNLDWDYLYCEECGDCDRCLGYAKTIDEAWNLIKHDVNINNSGGWDLIYIKDFLVGCFDSTEKYFDRLVNEEIEYRKSNPDLFK